MNKLNKLPTFTFVRLTFIFGFSRDFNSKSVHYEPVVVYLSKLRQFQEIF